ncbi:MAG: hypothetical protein WBC91_10440 [Phototrophicaceae bacterium]
MAKFNKSDFKIRYELFDKHALKDQSIYYDKVVRRSDLASRQVNFIRASLALFTGIASAIAAVVAQAYLVGECNPQAFCNTMEGIVIFAVIISILLPAIGGFFSSLADLYQWERISTIYDSAKRNITVADAMSPHDDEEYKDYVASFAAYVNGTLQVMSDETAQWGQSIQEPEKTKMFIDQARKRAARYNGDPDSWKDLGFADDGTDEPSSSNDSPTG